MMDRGSDVESIEGKGPVSPTEEPKKKDREFPSAQLDTLFNQGAR